MGQLGNGNTTSTLLTNSVAVNMSAFPSRKMLKISVGTKHACGILDDESLVCWGDNTFGQLGAGSSATHLSTPTLVLTGANNTVKGVSAGQGSTCAVISHAGQGKVKPVCWGDNSQGGAGMNTSSGTAAFYGKTAGEMTAVVDSTLLNTLIGANVVAVSAGFNHNCAISSSAGKLFCWGGNGQGQLMVGSGEFGVGTAGVPLSNLAGFMAASSYWDFFSGITQVVASGAATYTCALSSAGKLRCMGKARDSSGGDYAGMLGRCYMRGTSDGTSENPSVAAQACNAVPPTGGNVFVTRLGVNPGDLAVAAYLTLGDGTTLSSIAGGAAHVCARTTQAVVRCFGRNENKQLSSANSGNVGLNVGELAATKDVLTTVDTIAAGDHYTCALKADNTVACWGTVTHGSGQNPVSTLATPTQIYSGK
jgi:alpha-tubulin suppressor-like RCC1 family protein